MSPVSFGCAQDRLYFEGVADPAIAKRGYSRDHRPDCVQVNIARVVTREGMPLGYEIFWWQPLF